MYSPGNVLYFSNFIFPNGNPSKPKYFIILNSVGDEVVVASLPTSKDHIPSSLSKIHGCIHDDGMCVNCYYFEKDRLISECGTFGFPRDTYVYGEEVMDLAVDKLNQDYTEGKDVEKLCRLTDLEFKSLVVCLSKSTRIKRKIKRYLPLTQ
jgi:hypothetical protein